MKDNKLLVLALLVGLFLIVSSIVVFGGSISQHGGSITQPANNSHIVIAGTYTFKGDLSGLNSTDNVTWFALPNGTASANATLIGVNTTANGTHLTQNTNIITTGHGRFSITASFNGTRTGGTPVNYTFNITHFNVTVDNEAPVFATVFFNYSSTNGSASNTLWVNATNTNGVVFNNTGTIQLLVQINNADLSNQTYLHELANTSLFYVFNSSSVGVSSAGMARIPQSSGASGFTMNNTFVGPGSNTLGNFTVNYTTVIDVSNFSEGNYSLVLYVADNSSSDTNDSVYSKFYYNVFEISVDKTPSITIEKVTTASVIDVFGSIKYKCSVSDELYGGVTNTIKLTKPSGATVSESFGSGTEHEFSVDDTNEAGEYTVKCTTTETAYGRLSASASATFNAQHSGASGGGTSGGGGGGSSSSGTVSGGIFVNLDLTTGDGSGSLSGSQGTTKSFSFDGVAKHTLEFTVVGTSLVTLTISSDPIKIQLNIGDTKDVDVDSNGVNDLKVTLNGITDGKADVTLTKSTAVTVEEAVEEVVPSVAEEEEEVITGEEAKSSTGFIITVIVVVVVIILAALLLRKKK